MKNKFEIKGEKVYIYFTYNRYTIISKIDFEKVSSISGTWGTHKNKDSNKIYVRATINIGGKRKNIKLHRFLFNLNNPKLLVHHINGNYLDNTREN